MAVLFPLLIPWCPASTSYLPLRESQSSYKNSTELCWKNKKKSHPAYVVMTPGVSWRSENGGLIRGSGIIYQPGDVCRAHLTSLTLGLLFCDGVFIIFAWQGD